MRWRLAGIGSSRTGGRQAPGGTRPWSNNETDRVILQAGFHRPPPFLYAEPVAAVEACLACGQGVAYLHVADLRRPS